MRNRKEHKPARIWSGHDAEEWSVECGVWRNYYYWTRGNNEEMNGWG